MKLGMSLLAILFMLSDVAWANQLEKMHEGRVRQLLTKPVHTVSKLTWHQAGDQDTTNEILIRFVLDKEMREPYRLRSIQALAFFPGRRSHQFLWQVVHDRDLNERFKVAALVSLGAAYQAEVIMELSPFLREESRALREGAIRGMGYIRDPRVLPILKNHLHQEEDLDLRILVEQSIAEVQRAEAEEEKKRQQEMLEKSRLMDSTGKPGKEK